MKYEYLHNFHMLAWKLCARSSVAANGKAVVVATTVNHVVDYSPSVLDKTAPMVDSLVKSMSRRARDVVPTLA